MDEEPFANMKEDKQHLSHGSWGIGMRIKPFFLCVWKDKNAEDVLAILWMQI